MGRLTAMAFAGGILATILAVSTKPAAQGADTYELDVVVTDKQGQPITDLRQEDFQIEDDGKKVAPSSFARVTPNATTPGEGRTVIVVLDQTANSRATDSIKALAGTVLQTSGEVPGARIAVVRLANEADTVAYDPPTVGARLNAFQTGVTPFVTGETPEDFLRLVTKTATALIEPAHRRKAIICIGAPGVCAIAARQSNAQGDKWPNWVNAMTALARSNTSVYALMPVQQAVGDGALTDMSGGTSFSNASNFTPFVQRIWRELGEYYLIGYPSPPTTKELRSISVKVARSGARVQARQLRGK